MRDCRHLSDKISFIVLFLSCFASALGSNTCQSAFEVKSEALQMDNVSRNATYFLPTCLPGYRLTQILSAFLFDVQNGSTHNNRTDELQTALDTCSKNGNKNCSTSISMDENGQILAGSLWNISVSFVCQLLSESISTPANLANTLFDVHSVEENKVVYVNVTMSATGLDWNCSFTADSTASISATWHQIGNCNKGKLVWCMEGGGLENGVNTSQYLNESQSYLFCTDETRPATGKIKYLSNKLNLICGVSVVLDIRLTLQSVFSIQCFSSSPSINSVYRGTVPDSTVCTDLPFQLYNITSTSPSSSTSLSTSTGRSSVVTASMIPTDSTSRRMDSGQPIENTETSNKVVALACGIGIGVGLFIVVVLTIVIICLVCARKRKKTGQRPQINGRATGSLDKNAVISNDMCFFRANLRATPTVTSGQDQSRKSNNHPSLEPTESEKTTAVTTDMKRASTLSKKLYSIIASNATHCDGSEGEPSRESQLELVDNWLYDTTQSGLSIDSVS